MNNEEPIKRPWATRKQMWILFGVLVLYGLVVYYPAISPGKLLFTTDDNLGVINYNKQALPEAFFSRWVDSPLAGYPAFMSLKLTNILLWILPASFYANWIHAIDLIIGSFFLALFLRRKGLIWPACIVGSLVTYWLGSTFFLTYAGHIGKFGLMALVGPCLFCLESAVQKRSLAWSLLAGAFWGGMYSDQADLALFFSVLIGPYLLYTWWKRTGIGSDFFMRGVLPTLAMTALFAFHPVKQSYSAYGAAVPGAEEKNAKEQWDYATQWSWPPSETIEFFAPGYMGWRSGEQNGPYWGKLGRSPDFETTGGFKNFKLENFYMGAAVGVLLLFGILVAVTGIGAKGLFRADLLFWVIAGLITFLLACGKFFPLYRLFYMLPGVDSIRNPVKFMQVAQTAMGIITAYGLHAAFTHCNRDQLDHDQFKKLRGLVAVLALLSGTMIMAGLMAYSSMPSAITAFREAGWNELAAVIAQNKAKALLYGGFEALLCVSVLFILFFQDSVRDSIKTKNLVMIPVVLMVIGQFWVRGHYVRALDRDDLVAETEVVKFLKHNLDQQRVNFLDPGSFYSNWLTYRFPYHSIPTYNPTHFRMSADYQRFIEKVKTPLNVWQLFAVNHVLGPASAWQQISKDDRYKAHFELVYAYNVTRGKTGGTVVVPASKERPGEHVILRYKKPAARYALVQGWRSSSLDDMLAAFNDESYEALHELLLEPEVFDTLPTPAGKGLVGGLQVESYRPGRVRLKVDAGTSQPILRLSDKYSEHWKAFIDGKPAEVFRCDYLFMGVSIPPGIHTIELKFSTPHTTLYVQLAGLFIAGLALTSLIIRRT